MIAVLVGAALGGVFRFWIENFLNQKTAHKYFLGTLFANIAGSFLLGVLLSHSSEMAETWVLQFGLALTGTFTTFGGFVAQAFLNLDSDELVKQPATRISKINWPYLLLTVGLSLFAAYLGVISNI